MSGEVPDLPIELDDLTDRELMSEYALFMSWVSYTKAELVQAENREERFAYDLRLIEAKKLIELGEGKGERVTTAKARAQLDPEVVRAHNDHLNAKAYRRLVEAVFDRCDRSAAVLSRELSRRIGLAPREGRQQRFQA